MAITWEKDGPAWVGGVAYSFRARVVNVASAGAQPNVYQAMTGGVSDLYGTGPAAIGAVLGDGTCNWKWLGATEAVAVPNKSVVRMAIFNPTVTACNVKVWQAE
jgi:hypothetical protein